MFFFEAWRMPYLDVMALPCSRRQRLIDLKVDMRKRGKDLPALLEEGI
jgi:hypothetical protein